MNDLWAAKMIIAFGADLNCQNRFGDTPLDLVSDARNQGEHHEIHEMLTVLHAAPGGSTSPTSPYSLQPLNESINSITNESYDIEESQQLGTYLDDKRHTAFVFKLEELLSKQNLEFSVNTNVSLPPGMMDNLGTHTFFDAMIARQNQLLRINEWKSTVEFKKGSGSRMLYLDGGGVRGLIEIEVLERIEALTGRRITELFDWIIGTSTGGILALCLVYRKPDCHQACLDITVLPFVYKGTCTCSCKNVSCSLRIFCIQRFSIVNFLCKKILYKRMKHFLIDHSRKYFSV